ncbi:MAG: hypothetical protein OHK0021_15980 [Bryobacter sp.]
MHLLRPRFLLLGGVLALQSALYFGVRLEENIPAAFPLDQFATKLGPWEMQGEEMLDEPTRALLQPDVSFMRGYRSAQHQSPTSLFVGYFKSTQANHPAPHSPTVCLPGAGWKEVYSNTLSLPAANGKSFELNEYVLQKGSQRLVVLYWYQNLQRTWAKEVLAKVYMLPDFFEWRRSDVALARVTLLSDEFNYKKSLEDGKDFARQVYPALAAVFQSTLPDKR